jgi:dynein heavy chain
LKKMFRGSGGKEFNSIKLQKDSKSTGGSGKGASSFQKMIENAVRNGQVLLLEDMTEEIDPGIEPIVSKAVYKEDGIYKIFLGDRPVEYD